MRSLKYILLFITAVAMGQPSNTVTGTFPQAAKKEIALRGYGFNDMLLLSKTVADAGGSFKLTYPQEYSGAALLEVKDAKSVIVLLNKENFSMSWPNLDDFSTLSFKGSAENEAFGKALISYRQADAKRQGLAYLLPLYAAEPQKQQFLNAELKLQENAVQRYVSSLPANLYAGYYLNLRRLLSEIPKTPTLFPERMPEYEQAFNSIEFSDKRLLRSGLYKELIDAYVVMAESFSDTKDSRINRSTDAVIASLHSDPGLKQDVAEYLFKLFEQRSLFDAAQHLAQAMLSDTSCVIDSRREALFEQYRKMATGNTAPDIVFANTGKPQQRLYDVKARYKLVVFGAGWCPTCVEEIPRLKSFYTDWKKRYNLEIIFISLDNDKAAYTDFTKSFPWISSADFKGWEGKAARDYYVSGTPTMYLLGADNKILLKPISPEQTEAWLGLQK